MSQTQEGLGISFGEMIRDLLLAMVSSQNEANESFISGVEELAGTNVTISYKKEVEGGKTENREIKGNALAFGILPALLNIQSGVIELRTAMTVTKNPTASSSTSKNIRSKTAYMFKTESVDAKYQNTYSYKAETSSLVRITVVPTPPPQPLMEAIKAVTEAAPPTDSAKP